MLVFEDFVFFNNRDLDLSYVIGEIKVRVKISRKNFSYLRIFYPNQFFKLELVAFSRLNFCCFFRNIKALV